MLALAFGDPNERRVPPRTPPQRLETLCRFSRDYMNNRVAAAGEIMGKDLLNRPERAQNMIDSIDNLCERLEDTYDARRLKIPSLRRCSYFDPLVLPNGGPRPVEQRKRRYGWIESTMQELEKGNWMVSIDHGEDRHRRSDGEDFVDPFDEFDKESQRGVSTQIRLSNDLDMAFKQIATAFRKWAVRYIAECWGQAEHQYHTKRLVKIATNLNELVLAETGNTMIDLGDKNWLAVDGVAGNEAK